MFCLVMRMFSGLTSRRGKGNEEQRGQVDQSYHDECTRETERWINVTVHESVSYVVTMAEIDSIQDLIGDAFDHCLGHTEAKNGRARRWRKERFSLPVSV